MSELTSLGSERWAIVATIDPDVTTASTVLSDAIDMASFEKLMIIGMTGTLGASATFDLSATQAATSGGTYKAITGKAITQLTQAGTDASDSQVIINVEPTDLDMDNNYRYVKASLTVGTATSDAGLIVLGLAKSKPATGYDLASVLEVV